MDGVYQFLKGIVATVVFAVIALTGRYVQGYLFPNVERPKEIAVRENVFRSRTSESSQRQARQAHSVWQLSIVTNRTEVLPTTNTVSDNVSELSLVDQVREASLHNPVSTYGLCRVKLPSGRRRGTCPSIGPLATSVGPLRVVTSDDLLSQPGATAKEGGPLDLLVYVHGFNVPLEDAVVRAVQLAEDIPFHGHMIAFSWQSHGRTDAYRADEVVAERYFWNLAQLLFELRQRYPESRLHVLAHSMGNRVALRAINALCGTIDPMGNRQLFASRAFQGRRVPGNESFSSVVTATASDIKTRYPAWGEWRQDAIVHPQIESLVMAAPDVPVGEYREWLNGLKHSVRRMVLYASDTDFALEGSRLINGQKYRAGDSRANLSVHGLTVVRVTGVDKEDPLGHSFYGSRPEILNQLDAIVNSRTVGMMGRP